ncbi:hypothetical protein FRC12_020787 [Ceratobasidium sp. 428]|nr:hypothetical protein FRC12_020787 [Ceratobasidium sp. 428]
MDTVPYWMNLPRLPPLLRRKPPRCEPKDFGRGDSIRVTPSLFEYKVLSAWKNLTALDPQDESRIEYQGAPFDSCSVYGARFEHSFVDWTQKVTTAISCREAPVNAFLETTITFADDISKDIVGQYYGAFMPLFSFLDVASRNYRKAVFAVLDLMSTDSLMIVAGQHLPSPILSFSTSLNLTDNARTMTNTYIAYLNGTVTPYYNTSMGPAEIYRDTVYNLVQAVVHAVHLDLGNSGPRNIFLDPSVVKDTFVPNLPPSGISPAQWVRDSESFYFGSLIPPYQTWAEAILAGQPPNLTLGNPEGLPSDSRIVSNYLCPSYQPKPMGTFLASIFVGTATMYLSVWAVWCLAANFVAKRMRGPCPGCTFGGTTEHADHCKHSPRSAHSRPVSESTESETRDDDAHIEELPKKS